MKSPRAAGILQEMCQNGKDFRRWIRRWVPMGVSLFALVLAGLLVQRGTAARLTVAPAAVEYRLVATWDAGLESPIGIAVAPDGSLYLTDARPPITRLSPDGEVIGVWAEQDEFFGRSIGESGGYGLFISPGLQYVSRRWVAEISAQFPILRRLEGNRAAADVKADYMLTAGFRVQF